MFLPGEGGGGVGGEVIFACVVSRASASVSCRAAWKASWWAGKKQPR